jgi:hypothetical protein
MDWLKGNLNPESPQHFIGKSMVSGENFPQASHKALQMVHY